VPAWLDPLRAALDGSPHRVDFFFRDDDVGWGDERLWSLLDLFGERGLPIDLAVIPAAVSGATAAALSSRMRSDGGVGLHQHGLAHADHEVEERKCEFGSSRGRAAQRADIARGRGLIHDLFGAAADPIFTPPWNRCTADTGLCLAELGFRALSREWRATPLAIAGLVELPVRVDWFARRKRQRITKGELARLLVAAVEAREPVGIMFHHADMDAEERAGAAELLDLIAEHPGARPARMRSLVFGRSGAQSSSSSSFGPSSSPSLPVTSKFSSS
jgi:hypothetical protein